MGTARRNPRSTTVGVFVKEFPSSDVTTGPDFATAASAARCPAVEFAGARTSGVQHVMKTNTVVER
jgi:hypothetical protein